MYITVTLNTHITYKALATVLALWFAARLAYVFASARIERWAARERCEASLRPPME